MQFKQSNKNKDYIDHLFIIFKSYCGSSPKIINSFDNRINKNKFYSSIKFLTFSLPCFNIFRDLFYTSTGIKIIPINLSKFLIAKSLAYWVMGDGYKSGTGFLFLYWILYFNWKLKISKNTKI